MTFDDILVKLDLTMASFIDPTKASDAFIKVYTYLKNTHSTITAKSAVDSDAEKVVPQYVKTWEANKTAKVKADKVIDGMLVELAKYEDDAAVLFHLKNGCREILAKYLSAEVDWREYLAERAVATPKAAGSKSDLATEYLEGKAGLTNLYGLIGHSLTIPGEMILADKKIKVPNLPGLPGNYGSSAAGANAKVYRLSYSIDGIEANGPKDSVRLIWSGRDRIGKTTTDLANLLDKHAKKVYASDDGVEFTYNGKKIAVKRLPQ